MKISFNLLNLKGNNRENFRTMSSTSERQHTLLIGDHKVGKT